MFDSTQVKSAPALILVAGTVRVAPARLPKLPVLPVTELLASVQEAPLMKYPATTASEIVTDVPIELIDIAVGDAGVAVPAVVVVILPGLAARLV